VTTLSLSTRLYIPSLCLIHATERALHSLGVTFTGADATQLGLEWGEKKSICNKFLQSNAGVTCITWPLEQVKNTKSDIVELHDARVGLARLGRARLGRGPYLHAATAMGLCRLPSPSPAEHVYANVRTNRAHPQTSTEIEHQLIGCRQPNELVFGVTDGTVKVPLSPAPFTPPLVLKRCFSVHIGRLPVRVPTAIYPASGRSLWPKTILPQPRAHAISTACAPWHTGCFPFDSASRACAADNAVGSAVGSAVGGRLCGFCGHRRAVCSIGGEARVQQVRAPAAEMMWAPVNGWRAPLALPSRCPPPSR
jgi:hypothetical protein